MDKRLYDVFTEKFKGNLPAARSMQEAFEKTNQDMGFTAYSSFHSYRTLSKKKSKKHR
jgi:hypothetical protein